MKPAVQQLPARHSFWRYPRLALAVLASIAVQAPALAGQPVELWVEVLDARGRAVSDLEPSDLEVVEGGETLPVRSLEVARPGSGELVLYFDRALARSAGLRAAAESLSGLAKPLTDLGEVEIVVAGEEAETLLRGRDPTAVAERLARLGLGARGEGGVLEIRRRTLEALGPSSVSRPTEEKIELFAAAIASERELVRRRGRRLLEWVSGRPEATADARGPRLLSLVWDGYDLDPATFYSQLLDAEAAAELRRRAGGPEALVDATAELERALAALGWTVLPIVLGLDEEYEVLEFEPMVSTLPDGQQRAIPGVTVRPGEVLRKRREAARDEVFKARILAPREPLDRLAEASGGAVAVSPSGLREALDRLARRPRVTYLSTLTPGIPSEKVEVRATRPGLLVRGPRYVTLGIPTAVTEARLEMLLAGVEPSGELDVAALVRLEPAADAEAAAGRLEARLGLRELEDAEGEGPIPLAAADLRVTVAVVSDDEARVSRRDFFGEDLRGRAEWLYRSMLELPAEATAVAVVIEELRSGAWGGRRASVVESPRVVGETTPAPPVVEIVRPEKDVLRGRVRFEAEVYDEAVRAVAFELDEREVARAERPPFAARLDLGRVPRRRQLTAVAYGADGVELGRDAVVLNAGRSGLGVEIVSPESFRGSGPVEVEAEVAVPVEGRLDRVLFFWNDELLSTLYAPPFRQRLIVPEEEAIGYVRVVAMLADGTFAEDVLVVNGPAAGERVDVELVELYVVVTDDDGRPVQGLQADEFEVRENGVRQRISTFSAAGELPLTLGLAIDSSASMFVRMPSVRQAAIDFLRSTFAAQDRAFLVDFDDEPRLLRSTTADLERLEHAISSLEADGRTALWESIVYSLVQLQGVRGRKALVVFSDGADEDDEFPFRSSLEMAKKMAVPIYLILMKRQPERTGALSLFQRSFASRVDRLVEATGGRVFYARDYDELGAIYAEIEAELRSQYLLAYYPPDPSSRGVWRDVAVTVSRPGLEPRTLSGYWP